MNKSIAILCLALQLLQGAAWADQPPPGTNPFTRIPGPARPPRPAPAMPARPTPLAPPAVPAVPAVPAAPAVDDPLVCADPAAAADRAALTPFQRVVQDYIGAYYTDNPARMRALSELARRVFAHPGSQEYVDDLRYLDQQSRSSPEAMYEAAKALQNRWEAAYGMELAQRLGPGQGGSESLGGHRADRVHEGESAGAMIGATVALVALGFAAVRNPTAIARYNAVFRALLPAVGFTAGYAAGHAGATALNASGFLERDIPIAPAHVMRLGVEKDDFYSDDDTLVRTLVPLVAGIGAGNAVFAAAEGETIGASLLGVIRAVRTLNLAATPAKIDPPVLIVSLVVSIVVEHLVASGIEHLQYDSLLGDVRQAGEIVAYARQAGDDVTLYRGADQLVATTEKLALFSNREIFAAKGDFLKAINEAATQYPADSAEYQAKIKEITDDFGQAILDATADLDQSVDADCDSYLALAALENQDAEALEQLSDTARDRARGYAEAFQVYRRGFEAFVASREEQTQQNLGEAARSQLYGEYFRQYVGEMRDAKDRQLSAAFEAGRIPKHAGHLMLEASAELRVSRRELIRPQADALMAEVMRNEVLVRKALAGVPGASPWLETPGEEY